MVAAPTRCPDARLAVRGPERDAAMVVPAQLTSDRRGQLQFAGSPRRVGIARPGLVAAAVRSGSVGGWLAHSSRVGQPEGVGALGPRLPFSQALPTVVPDDPAAGSACAPPFLGSPSRRQSARLPLAGFPRREVAK
jgi:hypothetical protein